jgi:hypothetical protein
MFVSTLSYRLNSSGNSAKSRGRESVDCLHFWTDHVFPLIGHFDIHDVLPHSSSVVRTNDMHIYTCAMQAIALQFALNQHRKMTARNSMSASSTLCTANDLIHTMWLWKIECRGRTASLSILIAGGGLQTCIRDFEKSGSKPTFHC